MSWAILIGNAGSRFKPRSQPAPRQFSSPRWHIRRHARPRARLRHWRSLPHCRAPGWPHGHAHDIDLDPAALEIACGRVRSAGHDHVTFEQIDLANHQPTELYDAVIGRLILIHVKDALAVLRQAVALVQIGGVIAFHEGEFSWLPKPCPECRAEIVMDGGPYSPVYEWIAETVISISSRFEAVGMPPLSDYDRDTLALRMRGESIRTQDVVLSPLWVGAFARKRKCS